MLPRRGESWQRDPRMGAAVIVGGVTLVSFAALAIAVLGAPAFVRFDVAASAAIRSIDVPGLVGLAKFATWIGSFWQMVVLTAIAATLFALRGKTTSALMMAVAVPLAAGLANVLKLIFTRARPAVDALVDMPSSYSFPSSHAVSSVAFFGALAFLVLLHRTNLKRAGVYVALCVLAAISVGLSRVYLGVHYLGDVIGGWLVGLTWLSLVVLVSARWGTGDGDAEPISPANG